MVFFSPQSFADRQRKATARLRLIYEAVGTWHGIDALRLVRLVLLDNLSIVQAARRQPGRPPPLGTGPAPRARRARRPRWPCDPATSPAAPDRVALQAVAMTQAGIAAE
jgi:hypothetical protein